MKNENINRMYVSIGSKKKETDFITGKNGSFSVPWKKSLKFRLTIIIVFLAFFSGASIAVFLAFVYQNRINNEFKNRVISTARMTASFLDASVIDHYLITLEEDNEYERILNHLRIKMKETGVTYIVVSRITEDCQIFVFDTDESAEGHVGLGGTYIFNEEHNSIRPVLQRISNGLQVEPYIHNSEWGHLFTAIEYVFREDGTVAGNIAVSIYLDSILRERRNGFLILGFTTLMGFCISILLNLHVIQKFVIAPIRKISKGIETFIHENYQEPPSRQAALRYGDELAVLERVLIEMESKVYDSMEAERMAFEVKNAFFANISHELRTPMNSAINMIREAMSAAGHEKTIAALQKAMASSNDVLSVINTILEMANIEKDNFILSNSHFVLNDIVNDVNNIISMLCRAKNIHYEPCPFVSDNLVLDGDKVMITQVLIILLRNSIQYTKGKQGSVTFTIGIESETDETATVCFKVTDNGLGMNAGKLDEIIRIFNEENKCINYGSSDILLSACNNIIRKMGSNIRVECIQDPGENICGICFTFSFEFPRAVLSAQTQEIELDNVDFTGKSVLVVDDVKDNRVVMRGILTGTGIEILEAKDGKQAVGIFLANAEKIDIILMDIMMPNMDGYEAAKKIRDSQLPNAQTVPIIAVTALSSREDIHLSIKAGMNYHIKKPVDPNLLLFTLMQFLFVARV